MPVKKETKTKVVKKMLSPRVKVATPKVSRATLSVPVFSLLGRSAGNATLPKEIFGAEVNEKLLTQALRVYLNNEKSHHAHTKTRGEVSYTTAKVWSQKGTGRARHGAKSAPIWVGGGVAFGPRDRRVTLELPQKMRKAALISALSQRMKETQVGVVTGLDKATGKTKEMVNLLNKLNKKSTLILVDESAQSAQRATRNLPKVDLINVDQVNALSVIKHQSLILTKEAISKLESRLKSTKTSAGQSSNVTELKKVGRAGLSK